MLQHLSLISIVIFTSLAAFADVSFNRGQIFECRIHDVQPSSVVGSGVTVEMPSSFHLYASFKATSIARVMFRLIDKSGPGGGKGQAYNYAIYLYRSSEASQQLALRGELANLENGLTLPMQSKGPLSMVFEMDQVRGAVQCAPASFQYAFVNMDTHVEQEATELQDVESLTVAWVQLFEENLLKQGFIETVNNGGVSNIGAAFQADRTCVAGDVTEAAQELKNSSAFINQDSLTVTEKGFEFRTDRIVGCEKEGFGPAGDIVCKIPKLQKNGALVRVPYCD